MCCLLMHLISKSPWYAPEMFGLLCDAPILVCAIYAIVEKVLDKCDEVRYNKSITEERD